ncbi:hypothetical protein CIRG_00946 [Coccidioides immitis RMSCC 2394]|uniref:Uncharacterized protein n=1 Tax=Coccidioides immitis RMSCC 2394 TaxID=404692 RepID=A0A0J6Y1C6_COCIT|nr:hypothetical protein CIRG_00946 [Coccidioides immitis RMSCC 2394]
METNPKNEIIHPSKHTTNQTNKSWERDPPMTDISTTCASPVGTTHVLFLFFLGPGRERSLSFGFGNFVVPFVAFFSLHVCQPISFPLQLHIINQDRWWKTEEENPDARYVTSFGHFLIDVMHLSTNKDWMYDPTSSNLELAEATLCFGWGRSIPGCAAGVHNGVTRIILRRSLRVCKSRLGNAFSNLCGITPKR